MPAIADKLRVGKKYDKRIKLTDDQREQIKRNVDNSGIRELSREFKVSRRLIQFILFPERLARNLAIRDSKKYYDREEHKLAMRRHRKYKLDIRDKLV